MFKLVVLSTMLALAVAKPSALGLAGLGLAAPWGPHIAAPLVAPIAPVGHLAAAPALAAYNYRGPLSLAPGQPASILAADGRPLDTLSVNLDRAAHLTARAIDHVSPHIGHYLKKRSAPWGASILGHGVPLGVHTPLITPAAPLHWPAAPWGVAPVAPLAHGAHWGHW